MSKRFSTEFQKQFQRNGAFSTNTTEAIGHPQEKEKKKKLNLQFTLHIKINSKWITDLNVRPQDF